MLFEVGRAELRRPAVLERSRKEIALALLLTEPTHNISSVRYFFRYKSKQEIKKQEIKLCSLFIHSVKPFYQMNIQLSQN